MTGAINYVHREGRYVMKYYLVIVVTAGAIVASRENDFNMVPPSDFQQEKMDFLSYFYSRLLLTFHCS